MANGKYRYLLKNVGLLTLSNFATKLLSFFLVPLYTSVLTTGEYGTYDLFNTTVGVLLPILTLNVLEGVLRFALDKDYDRGALVTVGVRYILSSLVIVCLGLSVLCFTGLFNFGIEYACLFVLMYFTQVVVGFVTYYVRGIARITDLSVSSVIASAVTITLNVVFLLPLHMGLIGYFLANIIGPLTQVVYLVVRSHMCGDLHLLSNYSTQRKEVVAYSKPLIANSIAWWVNNVSDRYIVIFFCGVAANGIYSVASKIPSVLNIVQSVFSQAWTLSSVKDFDSEDKDGFFSNTYAAYSCLLTIICSGLIVADKFLAGFLYANEFYSAWRYVPWLTIAILFGALAGYLGGFFTAVRDSKEFSRSTTIGAVVNIFLNIILVPLIGPLGAAIATAVCYAVVWAIRLMRSRHYIQLKINIRRDLFAYVILGLQSSALLFVDDLLLLYLILGPLFLLICFLYLCELKTFVNKIVSTLRS